MTDEQAVETVKEWAEAKGYTPSDAKVRDIAKGLVCLIEYNIGEFFADLNDNDFAE